MEDQVSVTLVKDNIIINEKNALTFRELYDQMQQEIKDYNESGNLEVLMNQKIVLNMSDLHGTVLYGYATAFIGFLEGGDVLIAGNFKDVYESNEN